MNLVNFSEDVLSLNPDLQPGKLYRLKSERPKQASNLPPGFDSQLEVDWSAELTARGLTYVLHPFTLYLPGMVCYTPDFIAWHSRTDDNGQTFIGQGVVYEVKGEHVKNTRDSRTRWRVAAGLHPYLKFVWVTRSRDGTWKQEVYYRP